MFRQNSYSEIVPVPILKNLFKSFKIALTIGVELAILTLDYK
jgi:hypothetical protein